MADVYERARPVYPVAAIDVDRRKTRPRAGQDRPRSRCRYGEADASADRDRRRGDRGRAGRRDAEPSWSARCPRPWRYAARQRRSRSADGRVDAMTVGQAFHWFRYDEALPEIRRVLTKEGGIALIWNSRDQESRCSARSTRCSLRSFRPSDAGDDGLEPAARGEPALPADSKSGASGSRRTSMRTAWSSGSARRASSRRRLPQSPAATGCGSCAARRSAAERNRRCFPT